VLVGAAFVQLLPIGLTSSHGLSSQSVPVVFGAIVIGVMALLPLGAADLLHRVLGLRLPGRHDTRPASHSATP
jgi:hypothetical protein